MEELRPAKLHEEGLSASFYLSIYLSLSIYVSIYIWCVYPPQDPAAVEELRLAKLHEEGLSESFLSTPLTAEFVERVARSASAELSPVCAIVGGVVVAEVIKVISGADAPMNNVFLFDANSPTGAFLYL